MIHSVTLLQTAATPRDHELLESFFSAVGFEPGPAWKNSSGRALSFLAPLANLEFAPPPSPGTPALDEAVYIQVSALDDVHRIAAHWVQHNAAPAVSDIAPTSWKSRLFTVEPVPGFRFSFWAWETPQSSDAISGDLSAAGMRIGIVTARWNAVITERLLQGSLDALLRSGARRSDITLVYVPGSWEIPSAARTLADSGSVDAVITIGCLIRGETAHYEAIYNEVARGIGESQMQTGVPHSFGVLTCETLEQALDRAGLKAGNKGFEAAVAAIEMVSLTRKLAAKPVTA
jgi:6,7-dimethyl-8-ribityllumazine synthase